MDRGHVREFAGRGAGGDSAPDRPRPPSPRGRHLDGGADRRWPGPCHRAGRQGPEDQPQAREPELGVDDRHDAERPGGATDTGNGVVLTADGQFVANDHLVDGAVSIMGTVGAPGNTHTYTATVIGHDSPRDVGLLQLQGASGLPTPAFGVSATVMLGEPVIAVGHAPSPGAAPAMTEMIPGLVIGIDQRVPATDPDSELKSLPGVIQIYASMQAEDNGGPVVNSDGQIIGVLVAEATSLQTQYEVPIAYAIPIKTALDSAQLIREGNGHL
ncbi:MAG: serine protease [Actinobacteria bacterium]|nr:MAG: serine protease [Actinomycetota bacterium]